MMSMGATSMAPSADKVFFVEENSYKNKFQFAECFDGLSPYVD